jgi:glycosyltransferase involved in cell wall biosynthesis
VNSPNGSDTTGIATGGLDLSVLIPVCNEAANVIPLHAELSRVLGALRRSYELIFVDDGSIDNTPARLAEIQDGDPEHVRVAVLRRNSGQTAALSAALDLARGAVLIPIDGDLQNDPADIPRLLDRLDQGCDVVSGWRRDRKDAWLTRKVPSWLANRLIARLSGVPLHDFGCTLKAYRRQVLEGVRLYGEMHRFIPIFATWQGARVAELIVNHRPRTAGRTKYGLGRTFNVVLDLLLIRFFDRYSQRPMHFYGRIGIYSVILSFLSFVGMLYYKFRPLLSGLPKKDFVETPLPLLVIMFFMSAIFCFLMGLQAEMVMRTYYESQAKTTYSLRSIRQAASSRPGSNEVETVKEPVKES